MGKPPNHPLKIWFSIINHPFWGVFALFLETPIYICIHIIVPKMQGMSRKVKFAVERGGNARCEISNRPISTKRFWGTIWCAVFPSLFSLSLMGRISVESVMAIPMSTINKSK